MVDEEYPPLGTVGMRDRDLGEDGKGLLYPMNDDDVGGVLLLDLLGHGEQRGLIQDIPPYTACMIKLHCSRGCFGPLCPRMALELPQHVQRRLYRAIPGSSIEQS